MKLGFFLNKSKFKIQESINFFIQIGFPQSNFRFRAFGDKRIYFSSVL